MPNPKVQGLRVLPSESSGTPEERLGRFVEKAKVSPALRGVIWESDTWSVASDDVATLRRRAHKPTSRTLFFTNRDSSTGKGAGRKMQKIPMVEPYVSFAKADVRLYAEASTVSVNVLGKRVAAHRVLESVLRQAGLQATPTELTLRHFLLAEESIGREFVGNNRYRMANLLQALSRVIDTYGLSRARIGYTNRIARPLDGDELSEEGQRVGAEKMISPEALNRLAEISSNPPDDETRLIIRIVDLMVLGGFRIGEVLTLPLNCWVENKESTVVNPATGEKFKPCGIIYAAEKVRDYRTKWLPPAGVEMARRAIDDLTRLCGPARGVAEWMEANPGRLQPFGHFTPDDRVEGSKACQLLGLSNDYFVQWKICGTPSEQGTKLHSFRVGDVEALYLRRGGPVDVLVMPSGRRQSLSESLLVGLVNQFHGNRPTLPWLPTPLKVAIFQDALSPSRSRIGGSKGILDGSLRVKTHAIRHWLNTIADSGGLSDVDLAKWMGRKDITQNAVYKHGTLVQRTNAAKDLILSGQTHGRVARIAAHIPIDERRDFLDGTIEAVHNTSLGLCLHNFAASPCPDHHECLRGCGDYLRVKGDEDQRRALLDLRNKEIAALENHERALSEGFYGADKWAESSKQNLAGISAALAIDDTPSGGTAVNTAVPVFPNAPSKRKELK
jgi:hypothetical protein